MYPIALVAKNQRVLIVGGGRIAYRKLQPLLQNHAQVTIVSPTLDPRIDTNDIRWIQAPFESQYMDAMDLVIACTDDPQLNQHIYELGQDYSCLVNNTSDKEQSDFYNMKMVAVDDVLISVSTGGTSYRLAKQIGDELQQWLERRLPELVSSQEE